MTTIVYIEKTGGKLTPSTRPELQTAFRDLPDGGYEVAFKPVKRGYKPTRYKFYFAHVLPEILSRCARGYLVQDGDELRPVRTTEELHECLKLQYNPVHVVLPSGMITTGGTTTALPDRDFISVYQETIISEFSGPPFLCEFMEFEEWAAVMKAKKQTT